MNIVWISFEDSNPDFGCYGDATVPTPNIDRIAREGYVYRNAFSTAPVCAPARAAVITGMYPNFLGALGMRADAVNNETPELPTPYRPVPPAHVKCVGEYFRAAGWYCTNNVKCDYQFTNNNTAPFTAWDSDWPGGWTDLDYDVELYSWRQRQPDQPFFAVFNLPYTHESCMHPDHPHPMMGGEPETDPASVPVPPYLPDTLETRKAIARHYDGIVRNDRLAGRILDMLEEDGLLEDTAIFVWSDHGPSVRGKRWLYDSGLRVPMIVRWPGHIEQGTVSGQIVSTVDLAPTVLSLAGLEVPPHMQGRIFLGDENDPRCYAFGARDRMGEAWFRSRCARDEQFKYIRNFDSLSPRVSWEWYLHKHPIIQEIWKAKLNGECSPEQEWFFNPTPFEELYDTENDAHETNNLAHDPRHHVHLERLRAALDEWMERYDPYRDMDEFEMMRRWFPDGKPITTAAPLFVPASATLKGQDPHNQGGTFDGPIMLILYCATQGASIGWTTDEGERPHWNLYTGPLKLDKGAHTLRAKAIRYGYLESEERKATFEIQ